MGRQRFYRLLAKYSDIVFILPAATGLGFGLGYVLDLWWNSYPLAAVILALLGAVAGFYQVLKIVMSKGE